uniref:Beta-defensin n=1 Tax=Suricata suricatta TaxID=37032 RepID=A0A673URR3_SURSU
MKLLLLTLAALLLLSQLTPGSNMGISSTKLTSALVSICLWQMSVTPLSTGQRGKPQNWGSTQKCWNLHGKCRHTCFRKEKIYVYCTNNKLCCVKPKYQPREKLRSF